MDKSHDMDDTTLLSRRFHALMDTCQRLINELDPACPENDGERSARLSGGRKAYTVHASNPLDEGRQQALIKVMDDALKQVEKLAADPSPRPGATRPSEYCRTKQVFTSEELHFLEETLRTCHPASDKGLRSDR
ncbi:hypothetical protein MSL71_50590 [Desulfoluna butyratoxydans]|uniref:Uncharacterized protein n=2 Tax=Desulfoluna butyratoxydans TaxID=231438 RepID=A0A4U8YTQ2_9BACT|nr:hypothetical protein MSL71_50590 [Desulfoluna butyratoxydans]